jgi:hypothetical protein
MRRFLTGSVLWVLAGCSDGDRGRIGDSAHAELAPPAATGSQPNTDAQAAPPPNDYAVYSTVLRYFMRPERGEHALLCEREEPGSPREIVATTQPLSPGDARRDSGFAAALPAAAAPLMAPLRAMDTQPGRALDADSLSVGVPIRLVPDSIASRTLQRTDAAAGGSDPGLPPLFWLSRVAYSTDGRWALVYAVEVCPGATRAMAADAESGAYEKVVLAPLEWSAGKWTVHPPLFLDIGLPRLNPRPASR